ncbi:AI-2E family transporter [Nonomuraea longicatena]|uniref:AI-2E family transporter n=1 Tax=Nonomuraea longicatena TaxID=83682 RepID=A0ABP4AQC6_9ACTN
MSQLSVGLRLLIGLAAAVIALAGIKEMSAIAGPAFLALTLTIAVSPLRTWLARKGAPWAVTTFVPLLTVIVVLGALALALVAALAQLTAILPTYADKYRQMVAEGSAWLSSLGITPEQTKQVLSKLDVGQLAQAAQGVLTGLLGAVTATAVIVMLLFGMALDAGYVRAALRRLPSSPMAAALSGFAKDTCNYLIVSTVFGLIVAVLDGVALWLLGVPLPVLWGLLAFITNYIPNIGFVIGLVPPALLALLSSGPSTMIWVILVYCVLNFVIQSLIQPRFVGVSAGLSTTLTMVSLLVWAYVLGALGAILAVPLSAFARAVLVDSDPRTRWASSLVAGRDLPPR